MIHQLLQDVKANFNQDYLIVRFLLEKIGFINDKNVPIYAGYQSKKYV
ncbi:MAG: hypothetical protein LN568_04875 [Rickettsia endosymbiont of Pseudomimeciton antennatum]|nr:hypothetical protein [Rickettsia endosymbiont of Pseudomimeciton antennatum]MCC8398404.1 hypothetical protein [Rickettsia endosymbiont of Labidopullus appendiculatus]